MNRLYRESGLALLALLLALWIAPAQAQLTLTGAGKGTSGGGALSCSYTPVTTATNGSAYTGATPSASGGTPAYTFAVSGTLPTGVTINTSTGVLSGTPTQTGVFTGIQVSVSDTAAGNANCSTTFTLTVSGPITTAIFSQCCTATGPSTGAAQYMGLWSSYTASGWQTTEGTRKTPTAIAGNFTAIRVVVSAAVASNTWTFSLRKNGVGTGLTCAITSSATSCNTTGSISSNGTTDLFDWESCPGTVPGGGGSCSVGSAPTTITQVAISALFVPTNNGESFIAGGAATNANTGVDNYYAFTATQAAGTTDDSAISNIMPTAGTIDNLYVSMSTTPGATKTWDITVIKNGSTTGATCQIVNGSTTCTSVGGTNTPLTFAAGDTISFKWHPTNTPTASAGLNFAVRWQPTTVAETLVFNTSNATNVPSTSGSKFVALNGSADNNTEALDQIAMPTALHIKSLRTQISTGPNSGSSQTRIMTLRSGSVSQSVTCTLSGSNAGTDTCNDSTHSLSTAAGDLINWDWTLTGTPASLTWSKTGAVVTIP